MSKRMVEYLVDDNGLDFEKEDVRFLQDLIGGVPSGASKGKAFLFDIVANMRNSIDVDKFDYLSRDSYNVGMKSSYDCDRLMKFSKVINNEICYQAKEVYNIYEMFHLRYSMHKQVYSHRVGKAIEYMISDAFLLADPYLQISSCVESLEDFTGLTDGILRTIGTSKQQELAPAREIVQNIWHRKLYKFVDEKLITPDKWEEIKKTTEQDIVSCGGTNLKPEDIILNKLTLNYAMKEKNPVDNVHFFHKWDDENSFQIEQRNVSLLIPEQFSETFVRVYVRDPEKRTAAQTAFHAFLEKRRCGAPSPVHALPSPEKHPHNDFRPFGVARKKLF